jgi:hypothetical protein
VVSALGSGRAGAIVILVLGPVEINLGGLAMAAPEFPQHWLMHHNLRDIQLDIGIDSTV